MTALPLMSTPSAPSVLEGQSINTLRLQLPLIAVDIVGTSSPGSIVLDQHGFSVGNICSRPGPLFPETQRRS
jgi:hypothetical protein